MNRLGSRVEICLGLQHNRVYVPISGYMVLTIPRASIAFFAENDLLLHGLVFLTASIDLLFVHQRDLRQECIQLVDSVHHSQFRCFQGGGPVEVSISSGASRVASAKLCTMRCDFPAECRMLKRRSVRSVALPVTLYGRPGKRLQGTHHFLVG